LKVTEIVRSAFILTVQVVPLVTSHPVQPPKDDGGNEAAVAVSVTNVFQS
jgi:hypothetical protein